MNKLIMSRLASVTECNVGFSYKEIQALVRENGLKPVLPIILTISREK